MSESLLRYPALSEKVDAARGTILDWLNPLSPRHDPTFPKPIKIGAHSVAFVESEVDAWIAARIAARDAELTDAAKRQAAAAARRERARRTQRKAA
ncbi:helix-turn-helix transcriptional regulator [Chitinilyticum litopenaei]|uniref:helix-turn-helix transcriptional regulator n=1 Tax=Chitinilyticum litopenaei TaxID=1121276 RepID=UPI0005BE4045|nr:AlpA family phage regulatory protein [Chitinilyticum litopenaei]